MKHYDDTSSSSSSGSDSDSSDDSASDASDESDPRGKANNHTAAFGIAALVLVVIIVGLVYIGSSSGSESATKAESAAGVSTAEGDTSGSESSGNEGRSSVTSSGGKGGGSSRSKSATASSTKPSSSSSYSSSSSNATASSKLPPNGWKAGLADGKGFDFFKDHISWWYDWNADTGKSHTANGVVYFPMLWGDGSLSDLDASRLSAFKALPTSNPPAYILGYNEPDIVNTDNSANLDVKKAAELWEELVAPWQGRGSLLGSPAMGMQEGGPWLDDFKGSITTMWDFTAAHISRTSADDVKTALDLYRKYGKPIVITEWEMAEVSKGWTPIEDQKAINTYIADCVKLFEEDEDVVGYAARVDGSDLGDAWPMVDKSGELTETGKTYLAEISKYH